MTLQLPRVSDPEAQLALDTVAMAFPVRGKNLALSDYYGYVVSTGTIGNAGSGGWSVSRTGVGAYTVTFTAAFTSTPVVMVTPGTTAGAIGIRLVAVAAGSFQALTFTTNTAAVADADFSFLAKGVR